MRIASVAAGIGDLDQHGRSYKQQSQPSQRHKPVASRIRRATSPASPGAWCDIIRRYARPRSTTLRSYSDTGAGGLPLVCLTGWCSSRARYDLVAPLLAKRGRVITVDWRGHGDSSHTREDFGRNEMVRNVLAVVDDAGLKQLRDCVGVPLRLGSDRCSAAARCPRASAHTPGLAHVRTVRVLHGGHPTAPVGGSMARGQRHALPGWRGGIENAAANRRSR